jgi:hypothetical protein
MAELTKQQQDALDWLQSSGGRVSSRQARGSSARAHMRALEGLGPDVVGRVFVTKRAGGPYTIYGPVVGAEPPPAPPPASRTPRGTPPRGARRR